jgi:ABC-type sugar transport system substrate-binding protein
MRAHPVFARLLVVALLLGLLASAPLAAAATPNRQDDQLQIAFSVPGLNFPFFVHMMNIARDMAAELDIELIELDGQDNTATQVAGLETMIAQGVDGIVVSPREVEALAPAIQAVTDAGIPIVTVDRAVTGADTLGHVGADNVRGGEIRGEFLLSILPDGGKVIELQGTVGASPAIDRSAGFNAAIADHPEIEVVFQQTAGFDRAQGLTVTEQALQANPEIDAIVCGNDDMCFGAAEATSSFGIEVPIIGFDALPEALQAIQDGTFAATVDQWPGRQTSGAMGILIDFLRNGTEPAEHTTLIEPGLITADNLGEAERAAEAGITPTASPEASPVASAGVLLPLAAQAKRLRIRID